MKKIVICIGLVLAVGVAAAIHYNEEKMFEIRFSLGKNIVATAKGTGIPTFNIDDVDGSIEYSALQLPLTVPVVYDHPEHEIKVQSVFSLTLNADRRRTADDIVHHASISISGKQIKSHAAGRAFTDEIIAQFSGGKWKRYIPASCPAVTGRSSFLNKSGDIDSTSCAIDPHYKFKSEEWLQLFSRTRNFEWIGEGILAKLSVGYDEDIRGITYNIRITFDDYKTKIDADSENEKRDKTSGDEKGWKSSEKAEASLVKLIARIKVLEDNAVKRGDTLIPRQ